MREKVVENKIKDYLTSKGIYHFKIHGDSFVKPGLPDIVACCHGKFLAIEVKRPGAKNEQSEKQKIHERNIIRSGGVYVLADDLNDVVDIVDLLEKE